MSLIVQKYGGTSVGDTDRIHNVANRIKMYYDSGHKIAVVVSAMGKTTDQLVAMASRVNSNPSNREMDMLLSTGEQVSIALLAMALDNIGVPAVSFTGPMIKMVTDSSHSNARILDIDTTRIAAAHEEGKVVIVAGFQGVEKDGNITTLGRGGSDTSAVALAVALKADECEIFTDVDGVYTTDPNKVASARKIPMISYDEMLELARLGAGVLHSRSVELASKHNVVLHVRSSFNNSKGTRVVSEEKVMEKVLIRGVSLKTDESRVSAIDIPDRPGLAADLFSRLGSAGINIDMIVQSIGKDDMNTISFTVPQSQLAVTRELLGAFISEMKAGSYEVNEKIAVVSAVGVGMKSHSGVAAKMFRALSDNNINIEMISTSEIKVSVVVNSEQGKKALESIHEVFGLGNTPE